MPIDFRELLHQLHLITSAIPSWLQVVLSYYFAVVIASWAKGRISERRGLLAAGLAVLLAAFLALRATSMLAAFLSG